MADKRRPFGIGIMGDGLVTRDKYDLQVKLNQRQQERVRKLTAENERLRELLQPFQEAQAKAAEMNGTIGGELYICTAETGEVGTVYIDPLAFERTVGADAK
jgi:hypothetical protein